LGTQLISRFYLKDYLSFDEVDIEFDKGLIVFTGPSGAGKSILLNAMLALFGNSDNTQAKISEIVCDDLDIEYVQYDIAKRDEFVIKQTNTVKLRFLLNNQTISKKNLKQFTKQFSKYLHLKDNSDFQNDKIIEFLDMMIVQNQPEFQKVLEQYRATYKELLSLKTQLQKIEQDEQDIENLKEFIKFEIQKIESIDPKPDEYDDLKHIKDNLSKKQKIQEAHEKCAVVLNNTHHITHLLNLLDVDSGFFDDAINEVNNLVERFEDSINGVDDHEIESILDRIENLSALQKKYGSIEDAIKYKEQKTKELQEYEDISFTKAIVEKNIKKLSNSIDELLKQISNKRKEYIPALQDIINEYLEDLYLSNLIIKISTKNMDILGVDEVSFVLNGVELDKISSGEFNRLRLALLTARSQVECKDGGVLFLDEIDANLSGKESASIAKVLQELAQYYQIFSISHQPQLSAMANQHFLVQKNDTISSVKLLDKKSRVDEISRMISGENITQEAIDFANKLLG
jgi:DNA repair protein RecN (Recombination protein N)